MADASVAVTPGVGAPIAVEVAGGLDYQAVVPGLRRAALWTDLGVDITANGDTDLVALVAAKVIKLYGLFLMANGAVDLVLKDGTTPTNLFPLVPLLGKGASWLLPRDGHPWCVTAASAKLTINCSAAVRIAGRLYYVQE